MLEQRIIPRGLRRSSAAAPTLYDVLGVSPSADSAQIRSAYVRQLKRHHPDSRRDFTSENQADVERFVQAYTVLKNDGKRAAYDAELRRSRHSRRRRRASRSRHSTGRPSDRKASAGLLASLLLLMVVAVAVPPRHPALSQADLWTIQPPRFVRSSDGDTVADPVRLQPVVTLAATVSTNQAKIFSLRCFEQAKALQILSAADSCIAFDTAFLYWRESAGSYVSDPYFEPEALQDRTKATFAKLDPGAALVRAASVRASTFEAVLRVVGSANDLPGDVTQNADSST